MSTPKSSMPNYQQSSYHRTPDSREGTTELSSVLGRCGDVRAFPTTVWVAGHNWPSCSCENPTGRHFLRGDHNLGLASAEKVDNGGNAESLVIKLKPLGTGPPPIADNNFSTTWTARGKLCPENLGLPMETWTLHVQTEDAYYCIERRCDS